MYEMVCGILRVAVADALHGLMEVLTALGLIAFFLHAAYVSAQSAPVTPKEEQRLIVPVSAGSVERLIDC